MFDGSTTLAVEKKVHIPITLPTGEKHNMEFFMTNLDEEYSVVLGYDWLTHHNLVIDWTETKIMFQQPPNPNNISESDSTPEGKGIDICLVSAQVLSELCWDPENVTFRVSVNEVLEGTTKALDPQHPLSAQRVDGTSVKDTLETIPEEYQEF